MNQSDCLLSRRRQRGVAAVELAIVLPILFVMMSVPIFFGRYFWHYTVAHKAAADAARYLSSISVREMRSSVLSEAARKTAYDIAAEEIADLATGGDAPTIGVYCGTSKDCNGYGPTAMPSTVEVRVDMDMFDNIFGAVNTGFYGWNITARAEVAYVGR